MKIFNYFYQQIFLLLKIKEENVVKIISQNQPEPRKKFNELIAEENVVKLLIFGNDQIIEEIARKAENKEKNEEDIRMVIWIQDSDFLTKDEQKLYRKDDDEIVVCILNMDNEPIQYLNKKEANSNVKLEREFSKAEQN